MPAQQREYTTADSVGDIIKGANRSLLQAAVCAGPRLMTMHTRYAKDAAYRAKAIAPEDEDIDKVCVILMRALGVLQRHDNVVGVGMARDLIDKAQAITATY